MLRAKRRWRDEDANNGPVAGDAEKGTLAVLSGSQFIRELYVLPSMFDWTVITLPFHVTTHIFLTGLILPDTTRGLNDTFSYIIYNFTSMSNSTMNWYKTFMSRTSDF